MLNMFAMLQEAAAADVIGVGAGVAMVGAGLIVVGTGIGIGRIGGQMTEAMARQPEMAGTIQTGAIILAALIEGVAFFGLVIAGFIAK